VYVICAALFESTAIAVTGGFGCAVVTLTTAVSPENVFVEVEKVTYRRPADEFQ
jgi:hypothetical protein